MWQSQNSFQTKPIIKNLFKPPVTVLEEHSQMVAVKNVFMWNAQHFFCPWTFESKPIYSIFFSV